MAIIQKRKCRRHNYWSIVESRRVNGKPRPVILEYLGMTEALLKKLTLIFEQGSNTKGTLKEVKENIRFVGALSPHHHKDLCQSHDECSNRDFVIHNYHVGRLGRKMTLMCQGPRRLIALSDQYLTWSLKL